MVYFFCFSFLFFFPLSQVVTLRRVYRIITCPKPSYFLASNSALNSMIGLIPPFLHLKKNKKKKYFHEDFLALISLKKKKKKKKKGENEKKKKNKIKQCKKKLICVEGNYSINVALLIICFFRIFYEFFFLLPFFFFFILLYVDLKGKSHSLSPNHSSTFLVFVIIA